MTSQEPCNGTCYTEEEEINIINEFLPSQLDHDQTKEACEKAIKDLEVDSIKAMGTVIKYLKDTFSS